MAKKTTIGERRSRILIEQPTTSRGTSGQELIEWSRVCDCWTKVTYKQAGSTEDVMADQIIAQTMVVFDIQYRDGLTEKMRITYKEKLFDILYFQEVGYRESILIFAQKQI